MDEQQPQEQLVDFDGLRRRVGSVIVPVAGLSLLGAVVDGVVRGLTFALLGRWLGAFILLSVLGVAVVTAVHALGGADRAAKRGERLASPDVGLAPRRFATPPWATDRHDDDDDRAPDASG